MAKRLKKKPPIDFSSLSVRPEAETPYMELQQFLTKARPLCEGREAEYIDYDEENPPTRAEARELCVGCPVLLQCRAFARAENPPIGVHGGELYPR